LLDKFVINAVVSEIFQRKDLITLYNSLDDHNKIRRIKQKLSGLEKAKKNLIRLLKGLDDDTLLEDIKMELNANSDEKAKLEAELHELETSLDVLTEEDRKTLCKRIARMMRDDECLEVKKYLGEVIEEIKISNADVELTLKIA
jgi:hypothetical protein